MVITDDKGDVKQAIVGPYIEGDTFTLKCDVSGGKYTLQPNWIGYLFYYLFIHYFITY